MSRSLCFTGRETKKEFGAWADVGGCALFGGGGTYEVGDDRMIEKVIAALNLLLCRLRKIDTIRAASGADLVPGAGERDEARVQHRAPKVCHRASRATRASSAVERNRWLVLAWSAAARAHNP